MPSTAALVGDIFHDTRKALAITKIPAALLQQQKVDRRTLLPAALRMLMLSLCACETARCNAVTFLTPLQESVTGRFTSAPASNSCLMISASDEIDLDYIAFSHTMLTLAPHTWAK